LRDNTFNAFVFLLIFWGLFLFINVLLSPWVSQVTNVDFSELRDSYGVVITSFVNIFKIMSFQVVVPVAFFISILVDIMALLSVVVTMGLITGK